MTAREERVRNGGMTDAEIDAHAEAMDAFAAQVAEAWRENEERLGRQLTIGELFVISLAIEEAS